jgi:hypothetical protein
VKGAEVIAERPLRNGWGVRVAYTLQTAKATATNAFQLIRRIRVEPGGDTLNPARVTFPLDYDRRHNITVIGQAQVSNSGGPRVAGGRPFAGFEAAAIVRVSSGLPYTMTNMTGDSLIGLPNSHRLPMLSTIDLLIRQPVRLRSQRWQGSLYLDVRNVLNRQNIEAVRRETGEPNMTEAQIQQMASDAYLAHPEPIPYESPRYRSYADLNANGLIEGPGELMPLYLSAARDYAQPLYSYGPPRLFRIGVELLF